MWNDILAYRAPMHLQGSGSVNSGVGLVQTRALTIEGLPLGQTVYPYELFIFGTLLFYDKYRVPVMCLVTAMGYRVVGILVDSETGATVGIHVH